MHIGVDGSGSFDVAAAPPGSPGVLAAVVVSERRRPVVEAHIANRCREWGIEELHAKDLSLAQLGEICSWIGGGDDVVWTASLTDSALFPSGKLSDWRDRQAGELVDATSAAHPQRVDEILAQRPLAWHLKRIRPDGPGSLPVPHFVEHLFVLPRVVGDAVQAAIDAHDGPEWKDEFEALSLWIDDSSARDAKAQIHDLLKPILASPALALVPPRTGRLEHPIFAKHVRERRGANLLSLLGDRIEFVGSHTEPLCQLADIVAWTVRRYAARPVDSHAGRLYRLLRPRQHGIEGSRGVRLMAMRGMEEPMDRYLHVAPLASAASL